MNFTDMAGYILSLNEHVASLPAINT